MFQAKTNSHICILKNYECPSTSLMIVLLLLMMMMVIVLHVCDLFNKAQSKKQRMIR
jgi:hypothetical protein